MHQLILWDPNYGKNQMIHDTRIRKGEMGRVLTKMVGKKWSELFMNDR